MTTPGSNADGNSKLYHNAAIGLIIACPLIALLPPRRLNLGTAGLGASWLLSANYLVQERRFRSTNIGQSISNASNMSPGTMPVVRETAIAEGHTNRRLEAPVASFRVPPATDQGVSRKSRAEEYQDKLDEGAGYGDIIKEQIWDVWNQDKGQKD